MCRHIPGKTLQKYPCVPQVRQYNGNLPRSRSVFVSPIRMSSVQLRNHIRRLRFEHSMTQEELALRTGVSRQTIMSIERGQTNPSVLLAYKIAAAFGVSITEVFDMEGKLAPV